MRSNAAIRGKSPARNPGKSERPGKALRLASSVPHQCKLLGGLALLPLCDALVIDRANAYGFVGAPAPGQKFNVDQLEAFLVPKGTFVRLNPYIIHGAQFAIHEEEAHVRCLLPGRTFRNDMEAVMITEEERAVLVME